MKKLSVLLLVLVVVALGFSGCSKKEAVAVETSAVEAPKKIALVLDPVGTNPFLTQMVDKLAEMKAEGEYNFEYSVIECADSAAWGVKTVSSGCPRSQRCWCRRTGQHGAVS